MLSCGISCPLAPLHYDKFIFLHCDVLHHRDHTQSLLAIVVTSYSDAWWKKRRCYPKCANGGVCIAENRCRCAAGYKGAWCQNRKAHN